MLVKKLISSSYNLSLVFGAIAALLCTVARFNILFMIMALFSGFIGFGLCCLHIAMGQREDNVVKLASLPMLILSLFLNTSPILCMLLLTWLVKHGS